MYLSRVEIDEKNRRKIRELNHVGAYHSWVEQSFPEEVEKEMRTRKLWRIDRLDSKNFLLIVSENKPNLERLEKYGVEGTAQSKDYSKFLVNLEEGLKAKFRITLNPVISVKEEKGERGRVMPHVTEDQQMKFLKDRSEKNGFKLDDGNFWITERGYVPFKKKGQKVINLSKVSYEGMLTIIDKEKFTQTLTKGFGKKKAYGFGMMTVIPLK